MSAPCPGVNFPCPGVNFPGEAWLRERAVPEPAPCPSEGVNFPSEGVNFPGEAWLRVGRPFVGMLTPAQVVAQHAVIER